MADQDIYQVTDIHFNNDQKMMNVYFYRANNPLSTALTADALADLFDAQILPAVLLIQNTTVLHTEIQVKNLFNPSDAFTKLITESGGVANTDEGSTFLAVNVTEAHNDPDIRKGRKAYGGLTEGDMTAGVATVGSFTDNLGDLCEKLADALQEGIIDTWFPVVVKRILTGGVYSLPDNPELAMFGQILSAVYSPLISTQNSRKVGHGE